MLLVDGANTLDVFEVVAVTDGVARVRTAFLFELGEELRVRFEQGGTTYDAVARVRAHVGTGDDKVTELELSERTAVG